MRWLTLLMRLPPTPTRHRVGVWRKLQRIGAIRLKGSGWILPETPETTESFQWLVEGIRSVRGDATLLHVDWIEDLSDEQLTAFFHKARAEEYNVILHGCKQVSAQIDRLKAAHRGSVPPIRTKLDALKRELDRIEA